MTVFDNFDPEKHVADPTLQGQRISDLEAVVDRLQAERDDLKKLFDRSGDVAAIQLDEMKIGTLRGVAAHVEAVVGVFADEDDVDHLTCPIATSYLRTIADQLEQGLADRAALVELRLFHDAQARELDELLHEAAELRELRATIAALTDVPEGMPPGVGVAWISTEKIADCIKSHDAHLAAWKESRR